MKLNDLAIIRSKAVAFVTNVGDLVHTLKATDKDNISSVSNNTLSFLNVFSN